MEFKYRRNNRIGCFIYELILLIFSVLLFVISNCSFIFTKGLGFFAWFAYIPVLFLIKKASFKTVWLWGGLYGLFSYLLYAFWLKNYDSMGLVIVLVYFFLVYSVVFEILRLEVKIWGHYSWFLECLTICAFDYIRTLGFAGLNYGIMTYTQWRYISVIQICDLIGTFGLNFLIIFCSCLIYGVGVTYIERRQTLTKIEKNDRLYENTTHIHYINKIKNTLKSTSQLPNIIAAVLYFSFMIFVLVYGHISIVDYSESPVIKVAAVQHNEDPHISGISYYNQNLINLEKLTDEALEFHPDIDIVIWPETAIVPAVVYHYNSGIDKKRFKLVDSFLSYINEKSSVFVVGNGHTIVTSYGGTKKTYNSALIFYPGKNVYPPEPEVYSKVHLVPFSEYFPYDHLFPTLNKKLMERTTLWEPGTEYKTFSYKDLKFSTPICFEDNFTDTGRRMYLNGSRAFFNMSNDSWSKSDACQYQHLAMAVIRSVENRIPSVRSTTSGVTSIIDPNGRVTAEIPGFCQSYVVGQIPVIPSDRPAGFYTRYGDFFGVGAVFSAVLLLIIRIILCIIRKSLINRK